MGQLEKQVLERARNSWLQRAVLRAAESVEMLTTAGLCGSIYKMYKILDQAEQRRKYNSILVSRKRLLAHGLLKQNGKFLELTSKGKKLLTEWQKHDYKLPPTAKWDGKWRVLIFDIPENRRETRDKVRNTLRAIGFKKLQQSVWVYPFDCEDFVTLLKADFKIGKDLLYLIAEGLEYDRNLRDHFNVYPQNNPRN